MKCFQMGKLFRKVFFLSLLLFIFVIYLVENNKCYKIYGPPLCDRRKNKTHDEERHTKWLGGLDYNHSDNKYKSSGRQGWAVSQLVISRLVLKIGGWLLQDGEQETGEKLMPPQNINNCNLIASFASNLVMRIGFYSPPLAAYCETGYYHIYAFNELHRWQQEMNSASRSSYDKVFHLVWLNWKRIRFLWFQDFSIQTFPIMKNALESHEWMKSDPFFSII